MKAAQPMKANGEKRGWRNGENKPKAKKLAQRRNNQRNGEKRK